MKKIYEFNVLEEATIIERTTETKESGETITVEKPVKKSVARKFILKRPNRKNHEEAEIYYGSKLSEFIRKGCLTRKQLAAKLDDDTSTISDKEKKRFEVLKENLFVAQTSFKELAEVKPDVRTEEQSKKFTTLSDEIVRITNEMRNMQMEQLSLYDHTAENLARDNVIIWWLLELAYREVDNKIEPLFSAGTLEEKDAIYSKFEEEENKTALKAISKFIVLISYCFARGFSVTQEEIDSFATELGLSEQEAK